MIRLGRLTLLVLLLASACSSADDDTTISLTTPQESASPTPMPVVVTEEVADATEAAPTLSEWHEQATIGNGMAHNVIWSPDGTWLAINGALGVWRYDPALPATESPVLMENWSSIEAFSGGRVAARDQNGVLRVWDAETGQDLFALENGTLKAGQPVFDMNGTRLAVPVVDSSQDPGFLSVSLPASIQVWDVERGTLVAEYAMPEDTFLGMRFDTDGRLLVAGSVANGVDWGAEPFVADEGPGYLSDDFGIRLWDIETGEQLAEYLGLSGPPSRVLFNDDGSRLVATLSSLGSWSSLDDHSIIVWDTATQEIVHRFDPQSESPADAFTLSADGLLLAAPHLLTVDTAALTPTWEREVKVWNMETGEDVVTLNLEHLSEPSRGFQGLYSLVFNPNHTRLAALNNDGTLWIWDVETGETLKTLDFFSTPANQVAFSPDATTALCASLDGTISAWDVDSLQRRFRIRLGSISSLTFVPDGSFVVGSWDYGVPLRRFDAWTGEELEPWAFDSTAGNFVSSQDGEIMATNGGSGVVSLRKLSTGELIHTIMIPDAVTGFALNPAGNILATGSPDGTITLWEVATRKEIRKLEGHTGGIANVWFTGDGSRLISVSFTHAATYEAVSGDNTLRVWDVEQGRLLDTFALDPDNNWQWSALSPDGRWLATYGAWDDPTVKVWDVRTGGVAAVVGDRDTGISAVAFSADGLYLLAGGNDGVLRIWAVN